MKRNRHQSSYKISKRNESLLDEFAADFKIGRNVSVSKGGRSKETIKKNHYRMRTIASFAEKQFGVCDVSRLNEEQALTLFERMDKGVLKTLAGAPFRSVDSYQSTFKCFWHWLMKSRKKIGVDVPNVVGDIIVQKRRPEFTYFTKDQVIEMCRTAPFRYRVLLWFLFDSGVRPQELRKLLVGNVSTDGEGTTWLVVPNHVAKKGSFGRRIKLLLAHELLREWIAGRDPEGLLFDIDNRVVNQFLSRGPTKVVGKKITLYDFRHSSCCYWLNIYRRDAALKYRFGWKNSDMIEYYTRYIGLQDDLCEDDLLTDAARTRLEKEIAQLKTRLALQEDQHRAEVEAMFERMKDELVGQLITSGRVQKLLDRVLRK